MPRHKPNIQIKRVYDEPTQDDGLRILVDRIWPRGLAKSKAQIGEWKKHWAPSQELRKWFGHDPQKWEEFQKRYEKELRDSGALDEIQSFMNECESDTVTLVFAAKDTEHNNAVALQHLLNS